MPTFLMTVQADDFQSGDFMPHLRLRRFQQESVLPSPRSWEEDTTAPPGWHATLHHAGENLYRRPYKRRL